MSGTKGVQTKKDTILPQEIYKLIKIYRMFKILIIQKQLKKHKKFIV